MPFRIKAYLTVKHYLFFILFFFSFANASKSLNEFGNIGYIVLPSAYTAEEASLSIGISKSDPISRLYINVSPFDWFDASIFYVDIANRPYPGSGFTQSYKDKGFNLKLAYPRKFLGHNLAIGVNDFAGTGLFSSEYMVLSGNNQKLNYSIGIGWGALAGSSKFNNPFGYIDDNFKLRPSGFRKGGGQVDIDTLFSGQKVSLFGALSYQLNNKSTFLIEYDPTITPGKSNYKEAESRINIGFLYRQNDIEFKTSFVRGNQLQLQGTYYLNFSDYGNKNIITKRSDSLQKLRTILAENDIGLEYVKEKDDELIIAVKQNSYADQRLVNQTILDNLKLSNLPKKNIHIVQSALGMEVVRSYYPKHKQFNAKNSKSTSKEINDANLVYEVKNKFPIVKNQIYPSLRTLIAARENFLHYGFLIENNLEIVFDDDLLFLMNIKHSLYDNFDELYLEPVDTFPAQVRSDNKDYLKEMSQRIVIGRMEVNYLKSFNREHFFRFTGGIFEEMFGGIGIDYVFSKENSNFSYGAEYYMLKKRDYKMNFNFMEYQNNILRLSAQVIEPITKIKMKLSIGEYIAGDEGYTLELSRRFNNGIEFTGFFSRTNVSKKEYGEGSFDKGIRLTIPFGGFLQNSNNNLSKWVWRPLTKDPASLIIKSIDLHDEVNRFRVK
tara:strand:+ start:9002 stop:10993 length:1992 start_codon:yes stop_codon:yes gene_type:complete